MNKGRLFVITGPSGAGLGEIAESVLSGRSDLAVVTPITARKMKAGDIDGKGLFFFDLEGWQALRDSGDILEETVFAGNDYGTSRRLVEEQLKAGRNVLLQLEIERAAQVKKNMPESVCIYIAPTMPVLQERYEETARNRFEAAVRMSEAERIQALNAFCDNIIISDDIPEAIEKLNSIID